MKIELTKINSYVYHVRFETRYDLTSTLLRFEEYFESPEFSGKVFTLAQFKKWYMKTQNKKRFTYYEDWTGYNVPSKDLKPFYEGKFNPLSNKEQQFLDLFRNVKGEFYIIGTFMRDRTEKETINHEVTHASFSMVPEYRKVIKNYFKDKDVEELSAFLIKKGYSKKQLIDEMNAYLSNDLKWLRKKGLIGKHYTQMSRELQDIYTKFEEKA